MSRALQGLVACEPYGVCSACGPAPAASAVGEPRPLGGVAAPMVGDGMLLAALLEPLLPCTGLTARGGVALRPGQCNGKCNGT